MSGLDMDLWPADEAGVSLVEVIMYSALTALVLSVLGGVFYVGTKTQGAVMSRDAATGAAQVASNSLQASVRNASSVSVSGRVLKARVATGSGGWQCIVWALTLDNKLVYKAGPGPITSTDYSTWAVLALGAGVGPVGPAFGPDGTGTLLSYSLAFTSGSVTVPVAGVVTANALGPGGPESCW